MILSPHPGRNDDNFAYRRGERLFVVSRTWEGRPSGATYTVPASWAPGVSGSSSRPPAYRRHKIHTRPPFDSIPAATTVGHISTRAGQRAAELWRSAAARAEVGSACACAWDAHNRWGKRATWGAMSATDVWWTGS